MITNEQIKKPVLASAPVRSATPLESEAHLAQEQGKKNHVEFLHDLLPARFRKETARTSNGG